MVINEKGVGKNVNAATVQGARAGTSASSASLSFGPRAGFRTIAGVLRALGLAMSVLSATVVPGAAQARPPAGLGDSVALSSLPPQAQETQRLILSGGPFPFPKDGVVFGNYEKRLERRPRGYYHEYTVPTRGARTRGARRIVCGGITPTEPDACFYTEDHYNSFHRIVK